MGKRNGHSLVVEIKQTSGVLDSAFLVFSVLFLSVVNLYVLMDKK